MRGRYEQRCSVCGAAHATCGPEYTGNAIDLIEEDNTMQFVPDKDYFLNAKGEVCDKSDITRSKVIARAGLPIPLAIAERYGLTNKEQQEQSGVQDKSFPVDAVKTQAVEPVAKELPAHRGKYKRG